MPDPIQWRGDMAILQGSVVGGVCETASKSWEAFGCAIDWQDTPLGIFLTKSAAKRRVKAWVEENA